MSWLIPSIPGWSSSTPAPPAPNAEAGPSKPTLSVPGGFASTAKEEEEEEEEDLDAPAAFPALNSAQRSQPASTPAPSFDVSPPSPTGSDSSSRTASPPRRLAPPSTQGGTALPPPPTTIKKPDPKLKKRQKVALAPGCSALDWARVKGSPGAASGELRGLDPSKGERFPMRVTLEELKKHNTIDDAWSVFNGRVYNITPYMRFHPGGEKELMRCAGRDGTKLFMLTHAWVNVEFMLDACLVGMFVSG